ncbi:disintegrin and metalloproteinase domain-containing protein 9 isoform X2 [Siniperca chuatsi]|uniref:disintegrin and metalloproteinase domain-containing protein 9 isoform X2 n=1 Tax=Siniperca chuatsi TaxID=119488 RepID=UPI001CE1AA46|nr:disintegrin and metalloproteinase domain-containing protein 9 isoform X2 [Siniperca chuatsi]
MARKYIFFAVFLHCYVFGIDNEDIFNELTLKLSKYSIVNPQVIDRQTRSINRPPQSKEKYGEETISFALNINNRKHLLHLQKNRDFLHPNFVQYSRDATGNHKSSYPKQHVHCYYHGEVEGYENSVVALSTCSGLRGVILLGNETFGLEPVPQSVTNEHILYLLKHIQSEPVTCGVVSEAASTQSHEPFEPGQSLTSLLRRKRNLPQTSYVELVLVVDNLRYNLKQNEAAVREEMVEMANLMDAYYKALNIRVVLVGLEIFKDSNPFVVDDSAGEVLGRFVKWRKESLLPRIRHDTGQLIVGKPNAYEGGVVGMAFVGTVCSVASSGGISVFSGSSKLPYVSAVVAHEMGHNLGMNHDDSRCKCDRQSCIMAASAGGSSFSSCSGDDFEMLIIRGGGVCLKNQPPPSNVTVTAECGNGRLDAREQCDCGKPEECKNDCCDAATCKFTRGSSCAQGSCCNNCQIRVPGTPCRESVNTCDLPEYCDGKSAFCPIDFYVMDGLPCHTAYCYEGRCQTYDFQCKHLFAQDKATKADDICFENANTRGNLFGNCGITSQGNPIKCSLANAKCGKVQCTNVDLGIIPSGAQVSIQVVNGSKCINADFNLGTDVRDPAYVNPGSPCNKGKTCLDFKCVNTSNLLPNFDCDAQTTCNGRGVCNNKGNCHCENGWASPNCDRSGRGGSIDSGPAQIDYSVRNGLLIFFLLVVPVLVLLILVLLYIFRRDSLDPCLKGSLASCLKSSNTQNGNANGQSNSNVQTSATTQAPPDRPGYPPATSVPISGYGELDYWNTETSAAPAQPPAPMQGPGVPKPILPKQPPN